MQVENIKQKKGKKPMTSNEVVPRSGNSVSTGGSHTNLTDWGTSTMSSKMLLIPRIMIMQLTSKPVREGQAIFGDFLSSLDMKKIGSVKQPLEIIPIQMTESWLTFDINEKGERVYRDVTMVNEFNDNWKFKDTENGKPIERDRVANLYCLIPEEVKRGGELPYLLSFRSTSRLAGRKIATQMYALNSGSGKSPAAKAFKITGEKVEGKKGAWVQLDSVVSRDSTQQEEQAALKWFKTIKAGQAKVDHDDIVREVKEEKDSSDVVEY